MHATPSHRTRMPNVYCTHLEHWVEVHAGSSSACKVSNVRTGTPPLDMVPDIILEMESTRELVKKYLTTDVRKKCFNARCMLSRGWFRVGTLDAICTTLLMLRKQNSRATKPRTVAFMLIIDRSRVSKLRTTDKLMLGSRKPTHSNSSRSDAS